MKIPILTRSTKRRKISSRFILTTKCPRFFLLTTRWKSKKAASGIGDFEYAIERERGFDFHEDLFQPFVLKFDLSAAAIVIASTEKRDWKMVADSEKSEIRRREKLIEQAGAADDFTAQLVLAADQFIVARGDGKTIIAGYPWFSDWGRDTMIALERFDSGDKARRDCEKHFAGIFRAHFRRNAAEPFSRRGR